MLLSFALFGLNHFKLMMNLCWAIILRGKSTSLSLNGVSYDFNMRGSS
jgi:hypothetical protein